MQVVTDNGGNGGAGHPGAPKPGVIPLRPLSGGEILDGAIAAIRFNPAATLIPGLLAGIAVSAVTTVVARLGLNLLTVHSPGEPWLVILGAMAVVDLLLVTVVRSVLAGLIAVTAGQAVLGRAVPLGQTWGTTRARLRPLLATGLLSTGLVVLGWAALTALAAGAGYTVSAVFHQTFAAVIVGVAGALVTAVLTLITLVRWSLAIPVTMLEGASPAGSLRRSWTLARHSSWRVLWTELFAGVVAGIAGLLVRALFLLGRGGLLPVAAHLPVLGWVTSAAGGIVTTMLTAPFLAGVSVLLYTDLRMRRERLDVTLRAAAASGAGGYGPPATGDPDAGGQPG